MRRFAAAAALAAIWIALPSTAAQPDGSYEGIRALLARRSEAILAGDEAAFMSTVDPADGPFARRQRLLFRGFQELPLADYRLAFDETGPIELTGEREIDRYGVDASPTVLHVVERYRIDGYDETPVIEHLYLTFVHRDGRWRVASDTDLDDVTLFSGRKLWEMGPIVTRESEHFLYVSHPTLASNAPEILAAAERALGVVRARWPLAWSERVVVLVPRTTGELRRILQASFDLDVFVAFVFSGLDRSRDWQLAGHRMILNWPTFSIYPTFARETILVHELAHAATREHAGPFVTAFVDEGMADWVASNVRDEQLESQLEAGTFDGALPRDFEFISGEDADVLAAYEESGTATEFAVSEYGIDAVVRFYRRLGRARLAPGTPRYHVDHAARAAFGIGIDAFERHWTDWLEATR